MTNNKNNDVKKPEEVVLNNPFDPAYQSENRTESIGVDPFVFGDESDPSKVDKQDKSWSKHKDDQPSHAMTLDEQIEMHENYDYNIGDSGQYPGGHI